MWRMQEALFRMSLKSAPTSTVRDLDQGHVIPNMAPPNWRGSWYPKGFDTDIRDERSSACAVAGGVTAMSRPQSVWRLPAVRGGCAFVSRMVSSGAAGADAGVADHDESTCGEIIGDLLEIRENDCGEGWGLLVRAPEQDDARRQDGRVGEEFPEVGIGGYEDPVFPVCRGHDLLIGLAAQAELLNMRAAVTCGAQQLRHRRWQALVDQESHAVSRTRSSRSSTARAA